MQDIVWLIACINSYVEVMVCLYMLGLYRYDISISTDIYNIGIGVCVPIRFRYAFDDFEYDFT